MNKYYYTFGSDKMFPFQNGWIVIKADSWKSAHEIFMKHFPCRNGGNTLNCAFFYDEKQWENLHTENWNGYKCYGIYED